MLDPWAVPQPKSLFKNTMPVIEAAGARVAATAALQPEPAPPPQVVQYQAPELKVPKVDLEPVPAKDYPVR